MSDDHRGTLEESIARLVRPRGRGLRERVDAAADVGSMSAVEFRVTIAARLAALERDVAEVRGRVNGLLFVVAGAVVAQLLLRVTAG